MCKEPQSMVVSERNSVQMNGKLRVGGRGIMAG